MLSMRALLGALGGSVVAVSIAGCGQLDKASISQDDVATSSASICPESELPIKVQPEVDFKQVRDRVEHLLESLHDDLKTDPGVTALIDQIIKNIEESSKRLADPSYQADADSRSPFQYVSVVTSVQKALGDSKTLPPPGTVTMLSTTPDDPQKFTDVEKAQFLFIKYFGDYFKGKYVDRFGNKLPAPAMTQTIGNTEIAGTVSVFMELIMDYLLRTPIWTDVAPPAKGAAGSTGLTNPIRLAQAGTAPPPASESTTPAKPNQKPQLIYMPLVDKGETPTAVAAFNAIGEPIVQSVVKSGCGITALKTDAVHYLSTSAGNRASLLAGAVGGSFGGIHVGLGIMGKFSIGDNQTVLVLAKTVAQKVFARIGYEASYRALARIRQPKQTEYNREYLVYSMISQYFRAQRANLEKAETKSEPGSAGSGDTPADAPTVGSKKKKT